MKADNINLLEFIGSSKRLFTIPVYQRNYDWRKNQCLTLFRDIEKIALDTKRGIHFLGTMVYIHGNDTASFREFIIIDGQQRLTSIMLLLNALKETITDIDLKEDIYESYLINKRVPEKFKFKLKLLKSDFQVYKDIINGYRDNSSESSILSNYNYFLQLINNSQITPRQIFEGIEKLEIVYIHLSKENENPQLIFESLNSTGLDLTQADLIRNYLLMAQDYNKQEELYDNFWIKIENLLPDAMISDFIRDYLTLKTSNIPNKDKVYKKFKEYYQTLEGYTIELFLQELKTYAYYYSWFKYCNCPDLEVNKKLIKIEKLKSTIVYPFLLSIFEQYYLHNKISILELNNSLDLIISYVLRRLICNLPTNALNKVFASLYKEILKNKYENLSIDKKISIALINKKGKMLFPNDILLKESFLNRDFYHFKQCKFILEEIEKSKSKENVLMDELTMEHIMPQTLTPKWQVDLGKKYKEIHETNLNKIGNLTLTGYNPELSNKSFIEKKQHLISSNIKLNRELITNEIWNEESVKIRGYNLFKDTIKIFQYPIVENIHINSYSNTKEFEIMDDVDMTGKNVYEIQICGIKYTINSWREFFYCICTVMYEYDSQIFKSLVKHNDFKGRKKRIITDNKNSLRKPAQIADTIYIEQNLSANDSLNYSKLVIEKYEGMDEEIIYKIK